MLRFFRRKHVAVDYDCREVRLVVFKYVRKRPTVLSLHSAAIPDGVDSTDASSLGGFLAALVEKLGLKGAEAVMCVGRSQAVLKSLMLPAGVSDEELASMVQYQVSRELPFAADEAVVDFTRAIHWDSATAEAAGEGTTVLAAAVRLPVIDSARLICEKAGLRLSRLGLRSYANLRAVYRCVTYEPGERVLLVNITADEAEIDVMCDESLEFSRAATLASGAAEGDQGRPGHVRTVPADQAVRRIVSEVTRSLQSFHAVQRRAEIDAALVAGATGLEKGVAAALAETLSVRCELFDPSSGFAVRPHEGASAFGAALGLAASGGLAEPLPFDFVNPKRPAPPKDTRRVKAIAAAAAAVVLLGACVLGRSAYTQRHQDDVNNLAGKKEILRKDNKKLKRLSSRVGAMEAWNDARGNWLDQLAHLSNTLPEAKELYLTGLDCSPGKVILSGRVKDVETVSRFSRRLMDMTGYEVRPKGATPVNDKFGYPMQFRLEVLISPKAEPVVTTSRPARTDQ